ncbi:MAG: hypothetical protein DPW09_17900 [Anaerolineae bacterium]|nr:hypothetical protein [Anaerolineae bacterium]
MWLVAEMKQRQSELKLTLPLFLGQGNYRHGIINCPRWLIILFITIACLLPMATSMLLEELQQQVYAKDQYIEQRLQLLV